MSTRERIVVIGAGAFGTALAAVISLEGRHPVTLIGRDPSLMSDLRDDRVHDAVLPGVPLPDALEFSAEPDAIGEASLVLFAMPSQAQADAARHYGPYLAEGAVVVTCAKGIDRSSGRLLTEVLEAELPHHPVAVLSGPGFAADIARGLPTAMAIAAADRVLAERLATALSSRTFRLYASTDRIGVQLGGALKNVLAIACGIIEGAGLGDSARAALISRGLAEMSRLIEAMGGKADTVRGLSGLGDLVLTGTSHQSRNLRFGIALGQTGGNWGDPAETVGGPLVEGAFAASVAARLGEKFSVELPVTNAVADIIDGKLDIMTAMEQLMTRPITTE
ncbi:NAD(P)H-dependent glycerol-3-phosphate dehydrogenase [Neorhizobium galegae]|uniref:NAD(P)H-dependent glycerol-3-phosphate dehydrogenase n=1 Tax=Neorhizobium galegae TaxID=399 RepID=UPI0006215775|nr:NAD(P)H-dependent glycerol-3-phosphate dehydrogenase [Neorhizobium galegae]CDZ27124.1 Glycerol-3-phosphate dehydrogenase [NAD(P)+] [Neorhizobium galegae bv. officinalis]KAA9384971.1 NAD(P)-dependent glycerol-3-phosphate dehydrogenase [Neorhizobium galegae]KAB1116333.1 NAD(P)-dependent glycerol-3-phosphate dehydrogenase [Neorhizobium galegae]MCM2497702.1 NAD(P)-dependent glycerol-3-phosphate dehydrogenase [Neorhizobium galegae]MCQ1774675.1 NAD(P)-dependent glycerol-3-phosphate dehydrogenase 